MLELFTPEEKADMSRTLAGLLCQNPFDFAEAFRELALSQNTIPHRRAVYMKRCKLFNSEIDQTFEIGYAETREDLESALRLIHDCYVESGYIDPQPSGMRLRLFEALPQTVTIIAKREERVVATVSLVVDSAFGLPMEESFGKEIDELRAQGHLVAETTGLAVDKSSRDLGVFARITKLMIAYALHAGVHDICIGVNPEHAGFYTEAILFEPLGSLRSYSSSKEDPVIGLRLNLDGYQSRLWQTYIHSDSDWNLYSFFFGAGSLWKREDAKRIVKTPVMTPELLRHFFVEKTAILRGASPKVIRNLRSLYPSYDFNRILLGNVSEQKPSIDSANPPLSGDLSLNIILDACVA